MTDRADRRPALWQRGAAVALLLAGAGLLVAATSLAGAAGDPAPGGDLPLATGAAGDRAPGGDLPLATAELPASVADAEPRPEVVEPPAAEVDTAAEADTAP